MASASPSFTQKQEIRRLLDPRHKSKIERIEEGLEALGKQLIVGCQAS